MESRSAAGAKDGGDAALCSTQEEVRLKGYTFHYHPTKTVDVHQAV